MSSGLIASRSFFSSSCIYTFRLGYSKNRTRYHQMPFSRYLRLPSQISVPDELEVVEDSEPEREERRMAEIKKHGKQAKRPRQNLQLSLKYPVTSRILTLQDGLRGIQQTRLMF